MTALYNQIREDLIANQADVLNLQEYYIHKYRSQERFTEVNVGIFQENRHYVTVQIYVADKSVRIREKMKFTRFSEYVDSEIITKQLN